jgi:DNA-binding beta-propeller fold protein YncE
MKNVRQSLLLLAVVFGFWACEGESPQVPLGEFESGVLIINEGAFGANDGEVYHFTGGENVTADIFERVNNRPFAGLIQDLVERDGRTYLVANTGKVEVVDTGDFSSLGAVADDLDITRSLVVYQDKLYISDWGPYDANFNSPESYIAVVENINGGAVAKKIAVSSRPEKMEIVGSRLLVANAQNMDVVNLEADTLASTVEIPGNPVKFLRIDGNLHLYARQSDKIFFHRINTNNFSVQSTIEIPLEGATSNLTLGRNGEAYVVTSTGWPDYDDAVAKISLSQGNVIDASIYRGSGFYGIGFQAGENRVFVADNNGFQGNGTVIVLDENGEEIKTIPAGRGPSGFVFK